MELNSSQADSSVLRLEDVLTDGKFVLDGLSVSKFTSRRNLDGFLMKFPHERDCFYIFATRLLNTETPGRIMEQNSSSDLYLDELSV